jgi:TRAP-type uncharacterized transport system fused permease subunit
MSMVTPPVALAAYTAASIAGSNIMRTSFKAFQLSLIGFVLPFLFIYRPQLLMLSPTGGDVRWLEVAVAFGLIAVGVVPLAAGLTGYFVRPLGPLARLLMIVAAALAFAPVHDDGFAGLPIGPVDVAGLALFGALAVGLKVRSQPVHSG